MPLPKSRLGSQAPTANMIDNQIFVKTVLNVLILARSKTRIASAKTALG
ncbi:hypothetical protein BH11CYA1_BH11CYA1_25650 [soil metagenome]